MQKYGSPTKVKAIRTPETLWEDLGTLAEQTGTSRNELIIRTMLRKVARELRKGDAK